MGVQVIEKETKLATTGGRVVLTSDKPEFPLAIEELASADARKAAIAAASMRGCPDPRVSNMAAKPYPVDPEGNPVVDQTKQAIAGYRVDVDIIPRMG
jgi:hypothetical protein